MNTVICIAYRDGYGDRTSDYEILSGEITQDQIAIIESCLEEGECVIAEQVGLMTPFESLGNPPTKMDHVWTILTDFSDDTPEVKDLVTSSRTTNNLSINEFIKNILMIDWDIEKEMKRLGMQ